MIISKFLANEMTLTYAGMMALIFFGGAAAGMIIAADHHSLLLFNVACMYAAVGLIFTALQLHLSKKHLSDLEQGVEA